MGVILEGGPDLIPLNSLKSYFTASKFGWRKIT